MAGFQIPAFTPFQWQIPAPLKGNWNRPPREGDRLLNAEIDWLVASPNTAIQFQCGGNSPVALSQIVSLYVDNRRCGSDVSFWFPDTGFELTVPAHTQGLFPVFTNALTFYAIGANVAAGDITILQVCNSLPPPIFFLPATQQAQVTNFGSAGAAGGTTQLIPATVSGTITGISFSGAFITTASGGQVAWSFQDGTPTTVWQQIWSGPATAGVVIPVSINMTGLAIRFKGGLQFIQSVITPFAATGSVTGNLTYTTP